MYHFYLFLPKLKRVYAFSSSEISWALTFLYVLSLALPDTLVHVFDLLNFTLKNFQLLCIIEVHIVSFLEVFSIFQRGRGGGENEPGVRKGVSLLCNYYHIIDILFILAIASSLLNLKYIACVYKKAGMHKRTLLHSDLW